METKSFAVEFEGYGIDDHHCYTHEVILEFSQNQISSEGKPSCEAVVEALRSKHFSSIKNIKVYPLEKYIAFHNAAVSEEENKQENSERLEREENLKREKEKQEKAELNRLLAKYPLGS